MALVNGKNGILFQTNPILKVGETAYDERSGLFVVGDGKTPFRQLLKNAIAAAESGGGGNGYFPQGW